MLEEWFFKIYRHKYSFFILSVNYYNCKRCDIVIKCQFFYFDMSNY
jgi:hypothetical protein